MLMTSRVTCPGCGAHIEIVWSAPVAGTAADFLGALDSGMAGTPVGPNVEACPHCGGKIDAGENPLEYLKRLIDTERGGG